MLLIKPYLGCNLRCKYCYEGVYRKKHKPEKNYNLEAILKRMEEFKNYDMALHGGEILCLPKKDVEAMLKKMYELKGKSSIQTNATLIDDEWIEIFKKYKTNVGVSWDGPDELSEYRPGTSRVGSIIERLIKAGVGVSMIIVVSKANAGTKQRLEKLKKYLLYLDQMKISGRLNPCYGAFKYELSIEKMKNVYLDLADFCLKNNLKWSPFIDIINGLQGKDRVCIFTGCDPFSTQSATVVLADGSLTNCMRTNKEDILLRHPAQYKTRNEILENVPQEYGGCQGCRYWTACFGGCPSGAIDNDWRNRTYLCPVWKALFEFYEKILNYCQAPLALCQKTQKQLSSQHKDVPHGDAGYKDIPYTDWQDHIDHLDASHNDIGHNDLKHNDIGHGDIPHGDWQDHKDQC